jgi:hypothetical protein
LHVLDGIRATARERHNVVFDVAGASSATRLGRGAWMRALKFSGHFSGAMFFCYGRERHGAGEQTNEGRRNE